MGVLNVTPDSFSDGGLHFDKSSAVERALRMVDEGADIIDVGGESTRPGSDPVSPEEEIGRTVPVIETIAKKITCPISIDTYRAEVATRALDAGASIVNDISGMRFDPLMPEVVSSHKVPVVIMHMQGTPKIMQTNPNYGALIPEILGFFRERLEFATTSGIREDLIAIDPGIGFGKTFEHNLSLLNNLPEFTKLGRPIVVGPSRKAFLGRLLDGAAPGERIEGTAAAVAISIMKGADIVRVHDVKEIARVARIADAIKRETMG